VCFDPIAASGYRPIPQKLLHSLHVRVLVGSTNIDSVQRKGMGIKGAHLVASALISSFQCAHHLNLIEHD